MRWVKNETDSFLSSYTTISSYKRCYFMNTAPHLILLLPGLPSGGPFGIFCERSAAGTGFLRVFFFSQCCSISAPCFCFILFRTNMSLNKTLSSSGVPREGWAGRPFRPRFSKDFALRHTRYKNFIYNIIFNVSEIKI